MVVAGDPAARSWLFRIFDSCESRFEKMLNVVGLTVLWAIVACVPTFQIATLGHQIAETLRPALPPGDSPLKF